MNRLEKTITPEMRRNEELLTRVEAGELTYEELDQMVLKIGTKHNQLPAKWDRRFRLSTPRHAGRTRGGTAHRLRAVGLAVSRCLPAPRVRAPYSSSTWSSSWQSIGFVR